MITVGVVGRGHEAEEWADAISASPDVRVLRTEERSNGGLPPSALRRLALERVAELSRAPDVDALALAEPDLDSYAAIRQALVAGKHVFSDSYRLSLEQARLLARLARRNRLLLSFRDDAAQHPAFSMLKRLVGGERPIWQPLYVRSLRLAGNRDGHGHRLDTPAAEALKLVTDLLGRPSTISAVGCGDERASLSAAFVTLVYHHGPTAHVTISLEEAMSTQTLTAVTDARTLTLDLQDRKQPLKIARGSSPPCESERLEEPWPHLAHVDPVRAQAERFVTAVAEDDALSGNATAAVGIAQLWETAHESMSLGGAVLPIAEPRQLGDNQEPPLLRVIEGGGRSSRFPRRRPALALL